MDTLVILKGMSLVGLPLCAVLAHGVSRLSTKRNGGLFFWRCNFLPGFSFGGCFYVSRKGE